jgi:hypothetical protein
VKTGGDVNYLFLEVLPRLRKGVVVHIHDIFLPQDYPLWWMTERTLFWSEQYLLQAFLTNNTDFQILLANNYLRLNYMEQVRLFSRLPELRLCTKPLDETQPWPYQLRQHL